LKRTQESSFLKKRTKKLLFPAPAPAPPANSTIYVRAERQKSFGSFLQKRTAFLACLLLTTCAAPPLTLFTLSNQDAVAPTPPLGDHLIVVEVARVSIPDDFDSEDILVHDGNVLRRSKSGRWASRLSLEITSLLTRDLAARYPQALVTDVRQLTSPADRLLVSITRLDLTAQGHAVLTADWQIVPENAASKILRDRVQFNLSGPVATDQDVVTLEGELVRRLAGSIILPPGI
jgi:uncharacterized lipoprotein YmbA